nr:hypothetical protein [Tanacetum cinerariifolium]
SLRFKMNGKSHTVNVDNFRDMLQICPKIPGQKFKDPPVEKEIPSFARELEHTSKIKVLSDANVNHMHQPWRSFAAIINKFLSRKTTALENLVFQVKNKNSKKNNDMYYLRFTKVIIDYFMANDKAIPRRNKMFWHFARDDTLFTIIRVISKHQDTQIYGALLPQHLTNQAILESKAYKTYHAYATGEKTPKPKYVQKKADSDTSPKKKHVQAPKGKRLKATTKVPKSRNKKLLAQGLKTLSEIALSEAEQIKIATKKSKIQFYSSYDSGSGADEGTGSSDNEDDADDQSDDDGDSQGDDDQDDDTEQTELDNNGDDFLHPKLSTFDEKERHDKKQDEKEEDSDLRVETPSYFESTDDEAYDDLTQGSSSVSAGFISNMLNPNSDTDVHVTTNLEMPPSFVTTLPSPPIPLIQPRQQTLVPLPAIVPKFKQTNLFTETISSIPGIVDAHLANKINEDVKTDVQLQSDILRDKSQAKNEDFINKLDENIKKVIKEQVKVQVKEKTLPAAHGPIQPWINNLARKDDSRDSFNELMDTPLDFLAFVMNQLKVDTLTLKLLAGSTFKLMKGSCKSLVELEYFLEKVYKATTDQLDCNNAEGRLTNLTIEEHLALNVSLRMFTRNIVIQRSVEDLQLGVESYQKKLNLTRLDTYRSNLKRLPTYLAYSNPRGFIYQNKDKKNKLTRINELHKFSDGTLNDVQTARDDILKKIRMKYLPQTYWRNVEKEREQKL